MKTTFPALILLILLILVGCTSLNPRTGPHKNAPHPEPDPPRLVNLPANLAILGTDALNVTLDILAVSTFIPWAAAYFPLRTISQATATTVVESVRPELEPEIRDTQFVYPLLDELTSVQAPRKKH